MEIDLMTELIRVVLYLGVPIVVIIFWLQYKWAKVCDKNIKVIIAMESGGANTVLAPKSGGEITIEDPETNTTRTWPVNRLTTISLPYPDVGFLPRWLQREIQTAIVNEGDMEPMLNRAPHHENIASPDVVRFLNEMAEGCDNGTKKTILEFAKSLATGPTRELAASPEWIGSLKQSSVLKALATVCLSYLSAHLLNGPPHLLSAGSVELFCQDHFLMLLHAGFRQ